MPCMHVDGKHCYLIEPASEGFDHQSNPVQDLLDDESLTCVTASQIYSKCIVAPLMRHPMVSTASTTFCSIRHRAPNGSSYAPGTCSVFPASSQCAFIGRM